MNLKNKMLLLFLQPYQKKEFSRDSVQKRNQYPYLKVAPEIDRTMKHHVTHTRKEACISNKMQLENSSTFIHNDKFSRKISTKISDYSKILQMERKI